MINKDGVLFANNFHLILML